MYDSNKGGKSIMIKPISLILALAMAHLILGTEAEAVVVGPYNITVDLPGFDAVSSVGPIEGSDGVAYVSYMVGIAEGNNTTPSNDAHRLIIDTTRFKLPFDISNKDFLAAAYDGTANRVYPGVTWDVKDEVMIEGRLATHRQNITDGIHFISYFANSNLKVTLGARNLTSEEFTKVLRTFHVQE
jgi:hypothetical protein